MNKIEKTKLFEFLNKNISEDDAEECLYIIIDRYKQSLGAKLTQLANCISAQAHSNLEKDFELLRRACSQNLTLNKEYSQKELDKTRECGTGYYETQTMKDIVKASTRNFKEKFPEYMPQTNKYIHKFTEK